MEKQRMPLKLKGLVIGRNSTEINNIIRFTLINILNGQ